MHRLGAAVAALLATSAPAQAGPLGVAMGAPLEAYAPQRTATPGLYRVQPRMRPPAPFETTLVVATPEDGICAMVLVSPPRTFDSAGAGVRAIFAHHERLIAQVYGDPVRVDALSPGAVLDQPTDFAAALSAGQRELRAEWDGAEAAAPDSEVARVRLEARGSNADATYVRLTYHFHNYGRCRARLDGLGRARAILGR